MDRRGFLRQLFLGTTYISARMWKSREEPLSSWAYHRNRGHVEHALRHAKWWDASTHVHSTHTRTHDGFCQDKAVQSCHLLFRAALYVYCQHGHHSVQMSCSPPTGFRRMGSFQQNVLLHCTFHSRKHAHTHTLWNCTRSCTLSA